MAMTWWGDGKKKGRRGCRRVPTRTLQGGVLEGEDAEGNESSVSQSQNTRARMDKLFLFCMFFSLLVFPLYSKL